jgi:hypothetical protein
MQPRAAQPSVPSEMVVSGDPHPCHGAPIIEGLHTPGCHGLIPAGELHLRYSLPGSLPGSSHHCLACAAAFFDLGFQPLWGIINERRPA